MKRLVTTAMVLSVCVAQALGQGVVPLKRAELTQEGAGWRVSGWTGIGYWSGDVTYQIGGGYRDSKGNTLRTWFPISELNWPISVSALAAGISGTFDRQWELRGKAMVNLSRDAGDMEDSDWEDEADTSLKTTFSKTGTSLAGWTADLGARYWFLNHDNGAMAWALAGGVGYLRQRMEWEGSDLDQWYPQNPGISHDIVAGKVVTYEAAVDIPWLEVAGTIRAGDLAIEVDLGVSPYAMVSDEDNHLLRSILSQTDAVGTAAKFDLIARYSFTEQLSVRTGLDLLWFFAKGTEEDVVYGGENAGARWEIDHEITSSQSTVNIGVGYIF